MEMKLEEAQICRLCGECESIYIDVFGEEGTKRFLGVKIHTKINILIDETDPLPKAICVQCLGKLEFVCDFQEECLRTQHALRERYNLPPLTNVINEADGLSHKVCVKCLGTLEFLCDFHDQCHRTQQRLAVANESQKRTMVAEGSFDEDEDKENTSPIVNSGIKRKRQINPEIKKSGKIQESDRPLMELQLSQIEEMQLNRTEVSSVRKVQGAEKLVDGKLSKIEDTQSHEIVEEKMRKIEKPENNKMVKAETKKIEEHKIIGEKTDKIEEIKTNKTQEILQAKIEFPRSRKIKSSSPMTLSTKKSESIEKSSPPDLESKTESLTAVSEKTMAASEKISEREVISSTKRRRIAAKNNPKDWEDQNSQKKSAAAVLVKLEKPETSPMSAIPMTEKLLKQNRIVWIPNLLPLPKGESPKSSRMEKSYDEYPPAGDEAENREKDGETTEKNFGKRNEGASMEVARKSGVEKCKNSKIARKMTVSHEKTRELRIMPKKIKIQRSEDEEEDEESNVKSKIFGKITDLMTEEQKQAIEKYYSCDMSVVDERMVGEKLIFLDRKKFGCKLCDASYTRQDKCQVHIWGHLEMKPYRCNACDFSTVTVSNIRCHIRKSHLKIKPYACELCEKRYVTAFLLEEHMNTHTGSKPYSCDICDFASASRQVLIYHRTSHKPVKDITCHVCGKEFYSKGRMRAHLIVHNQDKAASMCKLCSIYLCNTEALQKHHANVHSKDYVCDACGKRCRSKKALNNHQNVHSEAKYKCTLCSNVYKSSHILKEHLLKHKGIRKYKCNTCPKDFAQQSHLAAHMAVHSDKRFYCPGCNRPFNRHDNMKMHTKRCEIFLADPELANTLSSRKRQTMNPLKNTNTTSELKKTVGSVQPEYRKTDNIKDEGETESSNVLASNVAEYSEKVTIIVENTIPCT